MSLTLKPDVTEEEADLFTKRCNRLLLAEVIDSVSVTENLTTKSKTYLIRLDLFPADEYYDEYSVTKKQVHAVLKKRFLNSLENAVNKALDPKRAKSRATVGKDDSMPEVGESSGPSEEIQAPRETREAADEDDSDDEDEGDATSAKRRSQQKEATSYEKPDEEEEEIVRQVESEDDSDEDDEGLGESMDEATTETGRRSKKEAVDSQSVVSFEFDADGQWCEIKLEYPVEAPKVLMLGIVEKVCRETVIHQLAGIGSVTKVASSELTRKEQNAGVVSTPTADIWYPI